ncbi:MAG: hypothetical protein KDD52_06835 [Bdellovibrionales bacterium]|nr:hypothetical protein [Bdellovibrionales bacterium]
MKKYHSNLSLLLVIAVSGLLSNCALNWEKNPLGHTSVKAGRTDGLLGQVSPGTLTYGTTSFLENVATNDGSFTDVSYIGLSGDTFTKVNETLIENVDYTISGNALPAGLGIKIVALSDTQLSVELTGQALSHQASDNVSGLKVTLLDSLFTSGLAPSTTNGGLFSIIFEATLTMVSDSGSLFTEKSANNGEVDGALGLTLLADTFSTTGFLTANTHYHLTAGSSVPAGLVLKVLVASPNTASVVFINAASPHNVSENVSGITVTFLPAAFTGGSAPSDGSEQQNIDVQFTNNPSISYPSGTTFYENGSNFGGIQNTLTASISLDPFAVSSGTVSPSYYSVNGVPGGLAVEVKATSASDLEIKLLNQANLNQIQNNTSFTITFLPALFSGAVPTDGSETQSFNVEFKDNPAFLFEANGLHNGNVGGRLGIDQICENTIATLGAPSKNYIKGFVSIDSDDSIANMPVASSSKIYSLVGDLVANDWATMLSTGITNPLKSIHVASGVGPWYSGSNADGTVEADNCKGFESDSAGLFGKVGDTASPNYPNWISDVSSACSAQLRYLCVAFD